MNILLAKRLSITVFLTCCTLAMSAQDDIRVNYQGAQPTISDFAWAFLSSHNDEEEEDCVDESFNAIRYAWIKHRKGLPQDDDVTLTIDQRNGYVVYEYRSEYESTVHVVRIEMCYWNESDKKHKLFAYNVECFKNGDPNPGQFDGLVFYRYNNATKKMTMTYDVGFEPVGGTSDNAWISYALPRSGKDITVTTFWYNTGKKQQKLLKWNGRRFSF